MGELDDLIIGSGLTSLAILMGLPRGRRVKVIGGSSIGEFNYYSGLSASPCEYKGLGGLGNYWHGVIPVSCRSMFGQVGLDDFVSFFKFFYPSANIDKYVGSDRLFVPSKPIRPLAHIKNLLLERGDPPLVAALVDRVSVQSKHCIVSVGDLEIKARNVWFAAGALGTARLLGASFGANVVFSKASDHIIKYMGYVDGADQVRLNKVNGGIYFPCFYSADEQRIFTLRPAHFDFKPLDQGIEHRSAFGHPASNVVSKVLRSLSPGLIMEALYNRYGIISRPARFNVYCQSRCVAAQKIDILSKPIAAENLAIQEAISLAKNTVPYKGIVLSKRDDLYLNGIHLHHTVNDFALNFLLGEDKRKRLKIVDASNVSDIGGDHHSFKLMISAYDQARKSE